MFKKTLQYYFAEKIVKKIQSGGESAFLCGGSVRDSLLGLPCKDVDVATSLGPKQVMSLFPGSELVGASFGVVLVKCPMGISVEVATFRTDSKSHSDSRRPDSIRYVSTPEEDCVRRDFSCNALYFNPTTKEIIDFVGGQKDIQNKILRCVGKAKDRFNEDALRILRAIRFVFRLGFTMDSELREAIIELAPNLKNISG